MKDVLISANCILIRAKLIQSSFLAEKDIRFRLISLSGSLNIQNKKVSNVAVCNDGFVPTLNNIRQRSSRDGLSNSAVICMLQDKERYLWMGTYDGLNKYNGVIWQYTYQSVRQSESVSDSLGKKSGG